MATKKPTTTRTRSAPEKISTKARFIASRIQFLFLGLAIASLVGGLGYNLLNQSEAASAKCRTTTQRVGSRGNCVRTLQTYTATKSDGIFGPNTKNAVQVYQRSVPRTASGVVDPATWSSMCNSLNSAKKRYSYLAGTIGCVYSYGRYR